MSTMRQSLAKPDVPCLMGEWRRPHNDLQQQHVGGGHKAIHDDETAAKIGFGKAPIHGTVHWSQFMPLFMEAFGPKWFETGSISVHFKTPVSHLQPVRAFIGKPSKSPGEPQILPIWMEHMDGRVVLEGTASVGLKKEEMKTMAQTKLEAIKPVNGSLLFARHPVGTKSINVEQNVKIDHKNVIGPLFPFTLKEKLACITEFHPWFTEEAGHTSPWGRSILPPECLNAIMLGRIPANAATRWPSPPSEDKWLVDASRGRTPVGLFGGCEVVIHNGPVFVDETYEVTREIVGRGETPKTEFTWTKTNLWEPGTGKLVAEMTLQNMMLKGSFDGYDELRAQSDAKAKL